MYVLVDKRYQKKARYDETFEKIKEIYPNCEYEELSKEYGLYRQEYCGCVYSKKEREINPKRYNFYNSNINIYDNYENF